MDIEKHQLLANPSRAFGELQTALNIDQGLGRRNLQKISCWRRHRAKAPVPGFTGLSQLRFIMITI